MNPDIHTHLEKLKTELSKLEPAVKHLQKADENATALITALNSLQEEYSKHIQNIEKELYDANKDYQELLIEEVSVSTKKITGAAELLSKSNLSFENQIKDFLSGYEILANAAKTTVSQIEKIDFPSRLDKLDATVSSINQGMQNIQMRIGDLERNLKDDIQSKTNELGSSFNQRLDRHEMNIIDQIHGLNRGNKVIKIMVLAAIVCSIIIIILNFLNP